MLTRCLYIIHRVNTTLLLENNYTCSYGVIRENFANMDSFLGFRLIVYQ